MTWTVVTGLFSYINISRESLYLVPELLLIVILRGCFFSRRADPNGSPDQTHLGSGEVRVGSDVEGHIKAARGIFSSDEQTQE